MLTLDAGRLMTAEDGRSAVKEVPEDGAHCVRYDAAVCTHKRRTVTSDDIGDLIGRSPHFLVELHEVVELTQVGRSYLQRLRRHAGV